MTLREIFVSHGDWVMHTLRRLGVSEPDLEDVTHELFLSVMKHLPSFDRTRPLKPWLYAFAVHAASDYRRRAFRRREVSTEVETVSQENGETALEAERDRRLLVTALAEIEPERAAVLLMHDLEEMTMPEIAAALAIPLNTGYSRLRLARRELQEAVRKHRREKVSAS